MNKNVRLGFCNDRWCRQIKLATQGLRDRLKASESSPKEELIEQIDVEKSFNKPSISKTIGRTFFSLIGTSLFCVITLGGTFDVDLLTPDASVKLPLLNYEMSFQSFLVVGPTVLISLWIYLHIYMAQFRKASADAPENNSDSASLWDFDEWMPRLLVLAIFYWMISAVLAVFAWKAWPIGRLGIYLYVITLLVTAITVGLQIVRCPEKYWPWAPRVLMLSYPIFCISLYLTLDDRKLSLFHADLSNKDLRSLNFSGANLREAKLSAANLSNTNLSNADLSHAILIEANLSNADLSNAVLIRADLSKATIIASDLKGTTAYDAKFNDANLSASHFTGANLKDAKFVEAILCRSDLSNASLGGAYMSGANLIEASLQNADFFNTNLDNANLSRAKLANDEGRNDPDHIMQQFRRACANERPEILEKFPKIEFATCEEARAKRNMKECDR